MFENVGGQHRGSGCTLSMYQAAVSNVATEMPNQNGCMLRGWDAAIGDVFADAAEMDILPS